MGNVESTRLRLVFCTFLERSQMLGVFYQSAGLGFLFGFWCRFYRPPIARQNATSRLIFASSSSLFVGYINLILKTLGGMLRTTVLWHA